jgi:hypothetical protein
MKTATISPAFNNMNVMIRNHPEVTMNVEVVNRIRRGGEKRRSNFA